MPPLLQRALGVLSGRRGRPPSEDANRSLRNALYNSADHLVLPVLWLIATPVFVARLGTAHYGIWMLVNGLLGFEGVVSFGLTDATVKYVARHRARQDDGAVVRVLRATISLHLGIGLLAGMLVALAAPLLAVHVFSVVPEDRAMATAAVRLAGVGMAVRFLHSIFRSALHGYERHDLAARVGMAASVLTIGGGLALVLLGHGLLAVIANALLVLLLAGLAMAVILKARLLPTMRFRPGVDRTALREIFGFGLFAWLRTLIGSFTANMDVMLIGAFVGPSAVTYYAISRRLAMQTHGLLTRATSFLFPFSGALFERGDTARLRRIYDTCTLAIVVLASGMVLPIFLFGRSIFTLWMGAEFATIATPLLSVLCIRYAILPMGIVNYHYLLGTGLVRAQTAIAALTAGATIAAMSLLVRRYDTLGIALGQLAPLPFMLFTRAYVSSKLFGSARLGATFSYFLPVVLPFGAAAAILAFHAPPVLGLVPLLLSLAAVAAIGWGAAFGIAMLCRRLGWMPT